ncbi:MAG: LysR family transcriptional regulator [Rudaea sp.]|uniref:LysR substrate-binding domain-containing protein n=1 Tax=unclassified Rudaea TaxID=2627037 RepID=UPI0010F7454E|nr:MULTISPECIES: LysR substrate-binding domain-containing protein [unclassified Rudaea]MBN8885265.1 LysR family transcriptional regulator [Rudaea sp.]MBR0343865.1 LysR family transcriptional regulator [Rudaea sp.]
MSKPPLHTLQAFVTVAREKNLTRAAAQMSLTVSALSHQMRALEQRLGQTLLTRGPRGVGLTPHGERLFDQIAAHIDGIERVFVRGRAQAGDTLTISALPSFSSSWLLPRLPAFMAKHPGLEFNLQTTANVVDFDREPVDVALRYGAGVWPGLTSEHLLDEQLVPVASPELVKRFGKPKPADLESWPLLGEYDDGNAHWRRWFAEFGGTLPKRYAASFTDVELLHRAAAQGLGVAMGRLLLAKPLIDNGGLVMLTRARMAAKYGHHLVYPSRSSRHPPLVAFREWLHGEIARAPSNKIAK